MDNPQLFYVGLKAFIVYKGKLLILQGSAKMEKEGLWGLPGGRIDATEINTPEEDVLLREIQEECGNIKVSIGQPFTTWKWSSPKGEIFLVGYKAEFLGGEINLAPEHKQYYWLDPKEDLSQFNFVPGYKEQIVKYFRMS